MLSKLSKQRKHDTPWPGRIFLSVPVTLSERSDAALNHEGLPFYATHTHITCYEHKQTYSRGANNPDAGFRMAPHRQKVSRCFDAPLPFLKSPSQTHSNVRMPTPRAMHPTYTGHASAQRGPGTARRCSALLLLLLLLSGIRPFPSLWSQTAFPSLARLTPRCPPHCPHRPLPPSALHILLLLL